MPAVSVDWWITNLHRMGMGINFLEPFQDASIIMVGHKNLEPTNDNDSFQWFGWYKPFSTLVWVMIVATVLFSTAAYILLDPINAESDSPLRRKNPGDTLYFTALAATCSHFEFQPKSKSGQAFAFSLSFWSAIILAAYVANLASHLVVKNTPALQVNSVREAVQQGLELCVWNTTTVDKAVASTYVHAKLVRKNSARATFEGVLQGECTIALTTASFWDEWKRDATLNGDCALEHVGQVFQHKVGGFATRADSGTLCSSFIGDVLNYHLYNMKAVGFIDEARRNHVARTGEVHCEQPVMSKADEEVSGQLNFVNMGGIFLLHWSVTFVAIGAHLMNKWFRGQKVHNAVDGMTSGGGSADTMSSKDRQMEAIKAIHEAMEEQKQKNAEIQEQLAVLVNISDHELRAPQEAPLTPAMFHPLLSKPAIK